MHRQSTLNLPILPPWFKEVWFIRPTPAQHWGDFHNLNLFSYFLGDWRWLWRVQSSFGNMTCCSHLFFVLFCKDIAWSYGGSWEGWNGAHAMPWDFKDAAHCSLSTQICATQASGLVGREQIPLTLILLRETSFGNTRNQNNSLARSPG